MKIIENEKIQVSLTKFNLQINQLEALELFNELQGSCILKRFPRMNTLSQALSKIIA